MSYVLRRGSVEQKGSGLGNVRFRERENSWLCSCALINEWHEVMAVLLLDLSALK